MEKNINSYSVYINYEIISQEGKKKDKQLANCFDKLIKFYKQTNNQEELNKILEILNQYAKIYGGNALEENGIRFNLPKKIEKEVIKASKALPEVKEIKHHDLKTYRSYIMYESLKPASKKLKIALTFKNLLDYYEKEGKEEDLNTIIEILDEYSTIYGGNALEENGICFNLPRDVLKQINSLEKSIQKELEQQQEEEMENE